MLETLKSSRAAAFFDKRGLMIASAGFLLDRELFRAKRAIKIYPLIILYVWRVKHYMDKKALHKISYGLYIVSTGMGDQLNGQVANTVFQITSEPPAITVCINRENYTHSLINNSGVLSVTVLEQNVPMELIGKFGFKTGREVDKFHKLNYRLGVTGAPVLLEHSIAFIEGEINGRLDMGTHTLFCARVVDCGMLGEGEPLTYAYYHAVKKGRAPKNAPAYAVVAEVEQSSEVSFLSERGEKYRCSVCGYVYEPGWGDTDSGIAAGTPFSELPETWICPICGAAKEEFVIGD